jgi:hypothetical protein
VFAIPAVGWWRFRWNPIVAFWFAYIVTRPLGASFADGFSKPTHGGLGIGDPLVSLVELVFFVALVAWVTVSRHDVQADHDHEEASGPHRRAPHLPAVSHLPAAPHHHGEPHHHGHPAPARLATELE